LVPGGAISMFFGEEKSGKSTLARYIGKCVANGIPVFGKYATSQRPVLCLDLENNGADQENFRDLFARLGRQKIHYKTRKTGVPALDGPGLLEFCAKYKPLLIIDSMTKFVGDRKVFDPGEMSRFFDPLLNLCAAGATIIIIHHAKKDSDQYANSHQIGANVARSFHVLSKDHPLLNRITLEGQLFRSSESVSENLIGMPAIKATGHFALADSSSELADLVKWVKDRYAERKPPTVSNVRDRKGKRNETNLALLEEAFKRGLLLRPEAEGKPVRLVPEAGNHQPEMF
jgi:hypothetical protein